MQAKSADNPVGLLGAALDWVIVDEAARLRRFIWEQVLSARLLDRRGWALLLSTPTGTNWFWEALRRGERGKDLDFESWRSPTWENPRIDKTLIEAERTRMSLAAFDQEYAAVFQGEDEEPCELCHGPTPLVAASLILHDDEEPRRCSVKRRTIAFCWRESR